MSSRLVQATDLIEVRQNDGHWKEGFINKKDRNGKYIIFYADGEMDFGVSTERIRSKTRSEPSVSYEVSEHRAYLKNEVVEARYSNRDRWFECKVVAAKRSVEGYYMYTLLYNDGVVEENVNPSCIRPLAKIKPEVIDYTTSSSSNGGSIPTRSNNSVDNNDSIDDDNNKFTKGIIVNINFGNSSNFTRGEIISIHADQTYTVKCLKTGVLKRVGFEDICVTGQGSRTGTDINVVSTIYFTFFLHFVFCR